VKFTAHLTVKDRVYGTIQELLEDFTTMLKDKFGRHVFNIQHQYSVLRRLKQDCGEDDIILHIDFAENYLCKYASEIQAVHFGDSHKQVSLHTAVAYTVNGITSLCSISSSMQHDPPAIWAHLSPVLNYLREVTPSARTLHVVSDGPTTQYRSKKNFFLLCTVPFELGFNKVKWNFLEAGHGKGPADGVGAAIKRRADDIVSKGMISQMEKWSMKHSQKSSPKSRCSTSENEIENNDTLLPEKLETVRGTMKIHQVFKRLHFIILIYI